MVNWFVCIYIEVSILIFWGESAVRVLRRQEFCPISLPNFNLFMPVSFRTTGCFFKQPTWYPTLLVMICNYNNVVKSEKLDTLETNPFGEYPVKGEITWNHFIVHCVYISDLQVLVNYSGPNQLSTLPTSQISALPQIKFLSLVLFSWLCSKFLIFSDLSILNQLILF